MGPDSGGREGRAQLLPEPSLTVPQLAVKTPLKAVEAVEGGEVTFSVDLTSTSAGKWFLDGQALQASSVYVVRWDGTRHTLTIRSVPASLHGAELKFVADGIESSIRIEVRGRRTWLQPPGLLGPVSSGGGSGQAALGIFKGQAGCRQSPRWSRARPGSGPCHGVRVTGGRFAPPHLFCLPPPHTPGSVPALSFCPPYLPIPPFCPLCVPSPPSLFCLHPLCLPVHGPSNPGADCQASASHAGGAGPAARGGAATG